MAHQRIDIDVGLRVDKTGLNQVKSSLQEIKNLTAQDLMKIGGQKNIQEAKQQLESLKMSIGQIEGAFAKAFNTNLGTLNISKFNQALSSMDLSKIYKDFSAAGSAGQAAFRNVTAQVLTTNVQLKQTNSFLSNMATTMANTVKWGVASSVMNSFTGSVKKAYGYVKSLDTSLNNIRVVTGKSVDEMDRFAAKANNAAKELGKSTTDYTNAALIYYQQGLSDEEVAARAETTLKAANVTGQSGEAVSEQLTAVWNGYKVSAGEAELYIDKLAAVAATTASNLEELSTGMSKVASAANLMGVDVDSLNAQISTIIAVTRQAPESVGTALKTIYARMGDIEAGLDGEVSLDMYTSKMAEMGVNVLDSNNKLRDMGDVIEEIGGKWETMSREQQLALSQTMAGTRQYNNLLALFDNWDNYTKALETSRNAAGTLQEQQDIYMESTKAHLNQLRAASEDLYDSLLDPKGLNPLIDGLTTITNLFTGFIDALGGGGGLLLTLGSIGFQVFSRQIAAGLATTVQNAINAKHNIQQLNAEMMILSQFQGAKIDDAQTQRLIDMKRQQLDLTKSMTNEERNVSNEMIKQQNALYEQKNALETRAQAASETYKQMTGKDVNFQTADENTIKAASQTFKDEGEVELKEAKAAKEQIAVYDELINKASQYTTVSNTGLGSSEASMKELTAAAKEHGETLADNISKAIQVANNSKYQGQAQKELNNELNKYYEITEGGTKFNAENLRHLSQAKAVQVAMVRVYQEHGDALLSNSNFISTLNQKIQANQAAIQNAAISWNNFIKVIDLRNSIQQFSTMLGKIGQFVSGLTSLGQIPSIFKNEDLSVGEKVLRITTSLTMGLTMLINGLTGTITMYRALKASILDAILMTKLYNNEELKSIGIAEVRKTKEALNLILREAGVKLTEEEIANLTIQEALKKLDLALQEKQITGDAKEIAMQRIKIVQNEKENVSIAKQIRLYAQRLAFLGPYIAATAAVAVVVFAVVKAYQVLDEAVENANASLQRQSETVARLQNEHKALQELIEGYEDAYNTLSTLTSGTQEYADALAEANSKAVELIETLGLFNQWEYGENGLIVVDEEAVQKGYDKKRQDMAAAEINLQGAHQRVNTTNWERMKNNATFMKLDNADLHMQNLGELSDEIYNSIKHLNALQKGSQEYNETLKNLKENFNDSGTSLDSMISLVKDLGDNADVTRSQLQDMVTEEAYRNEQMAKVSAEYQDLFQNDIKGLAANAYGNLLAQNEDFQKTTKENALAASYNVDNYQFKELLEKFEGGKTWGAIGINDKELMKYHAKYVEKWSEDEIKKAQYEKGRGEGTLTSGDKNYTMDDEQMRREVYQALMSLNLAEGLDKDGQKAYDDKQIQSDINRILNSGTLETTTKNAVLTAMSNYDESKGLDGFEGLDLSLIHPKDMKDLLRQAEQMGQEIGDALTHKLNSLGKTPEESAEKQEELYYDRIDKQDSEFIDQQAQAEEIDTATLERQTELILENTSALEDNKNAAKQLAVNNTLMNKGMETLIENWEEWGALLKKGDKTHSDYAKTITEVAKCIEDLIGLSDGMGEKLSSSFFDSAENLELLDKAAQGSEEAVEELGFAAAENLVANWDFDADALQADIEAMGDEFEGIKLSGGTFGWSSDLLTQEFDMAKANVLATIEEIKNAEMGIGDNLAGAIGPEDTANFVNSLNDMAIATKMSVADMQGVLNSMSLKAKVTTTPVSTTYQVPIYKTEERIINPGDGDKVPRVTETATWQVRSEPHYGFIDVAQIAYDGSSPSAAPITKIGRGSSSGGGKKGSGGGGGGGGGGGRGSTKKSSKTKLDKDKQKIDRYHDINNELSKLSTTMERLADAQEHLFGRELYDNLNRQLRVLNKQIAASKEKLKIAKEESKELQDQLEDKGFTFDIDGDISNYTEKLEEYKKAIDSKISKYNKKSAKEQNRKAGKKLKKDIEKLQEEYEEIEELIESYDELLIETIPELEDEITQFARQKVEIEVEKFKIEAELRLEISEAVRNWNDFKKEIFKDSENVADAILDTIQNGLINSGTLAKDTQDLNTINKAIADIKAGERTTESEQYLLRDEEGNILYDRYGNYQFDMTAALEVQEEYMDRVKDAISGFYEDMEEMYDTYIESVETAVESTENYQDALEAVSDVLEHTMNMITAINGEDAFDEIGKVIEKQLDATTNMIKSAQDEIARISGPQFDKDGNELPSRLNQAKAELDGLTKEIAEKEVQIANMGAGADKTQAQIELETMKRMAEAKKNEIEAYQEALNSNQELLRESLEEYVDLLTQQYENMVAQANKSFENFMSGGLGREGMDREWQNAIAEEDKYLDAVNAAYELRSLENKINDSINATDSLAAQRKLNQFKEEELKKLREKDKLTKYEVERANKLYEIELKKIALEEAQNNKAQMRLRRDSSGNYSYQFVADQESVNKAQQELDAAMNDLYNTDKEEYRSRLEEVSQVEQDFEDFRMWYSEQSAEYRAENEKWYLEQCESYQKQLTDSSNIAATARNNTIDSANKAMGESFNQVVMESMLPTWDTAMAEMVDRVNNPDSGFKAAATSAMNSVVDASKALAEALKELNSLLGLSDGGLADVTSSYYTAAEQGAKDYATAQQANIDNTWKEVDAVKALVDEFEKLAKAKETAGLLAGGVSAVEQGTNTGNDIRKTDADSIATNPETPDDPVPETTMVATLTTERKKKIVANILYGGKKGRNDWGEIGSDLQRDLLESVFGPDQADEVLEFLAATKGEDKDKNGSIYKYYLNGKNTDRYITYNTAKDFKKNKEVLAFDTGGYTGDWDDNSGRVAVLHKKELVLNAKDTENLLKTINIVRKITEDAISGKANKDKKDLDYKINTLLQSVVDISKTLAPMLQTDKWNVLQDEIKQESLNALTEQLTNLGVNLQEFQGADFLIALDHLNNTKDNLQSLVQTNQSQLLLNSDNAEQELALLEKLNQAMINDVASVIQTQTEKISNNEANQEQILMRMLEETMKSAERDNDIQQTVEIHADFPNATNTDEIQKAFENLVNAASQHAFINKR